MTTPVERTSQEIMYFYLRDVLNYSNSLTEKQIKDLFLRILKDYFDNNIDISMFSSLSSHLFFEITKPEIINSFNDELFARVIDYASDIGFYAKNMKLGENKKTYNFFIKDIKDYYKQNKKLLKNIDYYARYEDITPVNSKDKNARKKCA